MSPQSHAQQLLTALYRRVLQRAARRLRAAWTLEPLPPRRLLSITPVGSETLVNVGSTSGTQQNPDIAVSSGGIVAFAWETAGGTQTHPSVAIRSDGQYLAVWDQSGEIEGQFFSSTGTAVGSSFVVDNTGAGTQADPDVAMDSNGDFVVVWDGQGPGDTTGVWARRYAADGTPLAGEFKVNSNTSSAQHDPAVAMADGGSFFIDFTDDNGGGTVEAEYFNSSGVGQGNFTLSSSGKPADAAVGVNATGTFVAAWTEQVSGTNAVKYQRFNGGTAIDSSGVLIDSSTSNAQMRPRVAVDSSGNALVVWDESTRDGALHGVFARHVFANGTFDGSTAQVNTTTSGEQKDPAVAMMPDGTTVVVWDGNGPGDTAGIFKQQYATVPPNQPPVNTVPGAQSGTEDTSLVFSSGNGNAISVSDPDAGSAALRVTLSVNSGQLTLASLAGLTFTAGDGVADPTMTFTGSQAAINAALNGLTFTPAANANGAVTLSLNTNDQGHTGTGGALSDSDSVTINVAAVNDAPVNTMPPSQSVSGGGLLNLGGGSGVPITVFDVDAGSAPLQVTLAASVGTITLSQTTGLTFSNGTGSGDSTMTFQGSQAAINAALDGMSYSPPLLLLSNPTITITTNDLGNTGAGGAMSDTDVLQLNSASANQPPVLTLPSAQTMNEDNNLIFSSADGNGISVDDPDAGGGQLQVTISSTHGVLSLSGTNNLTFTTGDGTKDAAMVFTGTLADINNALQGLVFTPATDYNGSAAISVSVNDQGNSGSGGALSDSGSIALTINAVNDPPVINLGANTQTINEDTPLVFSSGNANLISITDVDAGANAMRVQLQADNGTLTLSGTTGLTFTTGDGTNDATLVFTGTRTNINAALAGMTFTPAADFSGGAAVHVQVSDQGSTGIGGAQTDSATVSLTVQGVNDPPVNAMPAAQTTPEDTPLTLSSGNGNAISISDVDAGSTSDLQVTLTATNGTFALADLSGVTFTTGTGAGGETTVTFTGTMDAINAALDGLVFSPTADFNGDATITIVTNDQGNTGAGGAQTDTDTLHISVTAVNDPPTLNLPATQTINEDTQLHFTSGNGNLISIADIDAGSGDLQMTLSASNGTLSLTSLGQLTFDVGDGTNDTFMMFRGTLADINAALTSMKFTPMSNFNGTASIGLMLSDMGNTGAGGAQTASGNVSITVNPVNDAPVNVVPTARTMNEDGTLVFSSANSDAISVVDVDAGSGQMLVSLASTNGTLTLARTTGLTFSAGDGTADAAMTFTGTMSNINAALNGMSFAPAADFNGSASVAIVSNDQGNTGSGGALSDSDGVAITVNAVNDPPVNTVPGAQTTNEDTPLVFSNSAGNDITVDDVDASTLRVWLHVSDGTLTLAQTTGLTFTVGDGTGDADMIFQGTKADLNSALDGLVFNPAANANGAVTLQVITNDLGATGSGGAKTDTDNLTINVNAVNDPPTIDAPVATSIDVGSPLRLSSAGGNAITIDDIDAGGGEVKVTLTASAGAISLSGTNGLTFISGTGTNDTTCVFTGTLSDINAALDGLVYTPSGSTPTIGGIQINVDDQGNTGGPAQTASANTMIEMVSEFLANTATNANQQLQSIAMDSAGNYIVIWSGNQQSNNYGIWAQRYDAFGNRIGAELHLNSTTVNTQTTPAVTMDASGDFIAVWASNANTSEGWEIVARRFSFATGDPVGNEIAVDVDHTGDQQQPAIAAAPDGRFLVTWRGAITAGASDIYGRFFNANGTAAGGEFIVNTTTGVAEDQPAVAADDNGNFVVAWRTRDTSGNAQGVFARRFDANNNPVGSEFRADTATNNVLNHPSVAMSWTGDFVVTWSAGNNQDGAGRGVFARRFDASGSPAGSVFQVNTTTTGDQDAPSVGMDGVGAFTIAWESTGQDGFARGVYAQKFNADGTTSGSEFRASGTTYGDQYHAAVAMSAAADLVVTWQGNGLGDDAGVLGQYWRSNNHIPINQVPSATQSTPEETALILSAANGNQISIGSFSPSLRVSLVATHGLITLATTAGLTFTVGDGSIDTAMTFTGPLGAINAALATLRYDPDLNYNGAAQISITTTDSTSGTPVTDDDTVNINVTPVNDTPTTLGISDVNVSEDAPDTRVDVLSRFADVEDAATALAYTISGDTNAALFNSISIDPQTHELVISYAPNANGSATLTLRATDTGGLFVETTFAVNVAPVNDAPTLAADTGADVNAGETVVVTKAMLQVSDVDNSDDQLTYTITELPTQGILKRGDTTLAVGDSFTQTDLDAGKVTYSERGAETTDQFTFAVSDSSGGSIPVKQFALAITQPPPSTTVIPPITQPLVSPPPVTSPVSSSSDSTSTKEDAGSKSIIDKTVSSSPTIPSVGSGSSGGNGSTAPAAAPQQAPTEAVNNNPGPARPPEAQQPEAAKPAVVAPREPLTIAPAAIPAPAPTPAPAPIAPAPVAPALPPPPPAAPVSFIVSADPNSVVNQKLDELHKEVTKDAPVMQLVAGTAEWASLAASVIYILWTIRAGYLLASLLSSMPAWTFVDPLPILDHFNDPNDPEGSKRRGGDEKNTDDDHESLQSLVSQKSASTASGAQGELS